MKPTSANPNVATCECKWKSECKTPEQAKERMRYHRIQCHNDQKLIWSGTF
jgi:hypothetical protein